MGKHNGGRMSKLLESLGSSMRTCLFHVLSIGPIPNHFAFIMDGNRRYAKKENLEGGAGHRAGFSALMSMLKYCYELGVKYVTIYAFSIDNFKRPPDEVQNLMDLIVEKCKELLKEESIVDQYGIRVYFIGNLKLLDEHVRVAMEKVMRATASNTKCVLLICIAYNSSDEVMHAIQESCKEKHKEIEAKDCKMINGISMDTVQESCDHEANESGAMRAGTVCNGINKGAEVVEEHNGMVVHVVNSMIQLKDYEKKQKRQEENSIVKLVDIERHMYMAVAPEPEILIRSSGETRLSNFLLWQTSYCQLYSPDALWPEIGLRHLDSYFGVTGLDSIMLHCIAVRWLDG